MCSLLCVRPTLLRRAALRLAEFESLMVDLPVNQEQEASVA
jgi:hypothetical protein